MVKRESPEMGRIPWPPKGAPHAPILTTSNLPTFRPIPARPATQMESAAYIDETWRKPTNLYGPATANEPIELSDDEGDGQDGSNTVESEWARRKRALSSNAHTPSAKRNGTRNGANLKFEPEDRKPALPASADYPDNYGEAEGFASSYDDEYFLDQDEDDYPQQDDEDQLPYSDELEGPDDDFDGPDDEEEQMASAAAKTSSLWPTPKTLQDPFANDQAVLDHRGIPLDEAAIKVAREYWQAHERLDNCTSDEGSPTHVECLIQVQALRTRYNKLVLGLDKLPPGTRTFEPPRVELHSAAVTSRTEPELSPEQKAVVDLAASGKNIFYTGSAGCGKSTVLHAIRKRLREMGKTVRVMAPTGKVAIAINGTTTWTFAGWRPDDLRKPLADLQQKGAWSKVTCKRFHETDTIIIDEISMVENLWLDRLNAVMKAARTRNLDAGHPKHPDAANLAFGGVQVIVTGDFCQLPPVQPFRNCLCGKEMSFSKSSRTYTCMDVHCNATYKESDKWAFRSNAWKECNFQHILLKTIHRQNDMLFIQLLQKCRVGQPFSQHDINILTKHQSVTTNAVRLFCTREEVSNLNAQEFARLSAPSRPYPSYDEFIWKSDKHPHLSSKAARLPPKSGFGNGPLRALEDHRFESHTDLKAGMLVLLLTNLDLASGLCNGSQGVIEGFEPYDPQRLPRKRNTSDLEGGIVGAHAGIKESHMKKFAELADGCHKYNRTVSLGWPIVRFMNGIVRTIYPDCQVNELGDNEPYSLLCRTQIPLAPAWALSVHKSQGMTLDRVIVNLSKAFEEGQVYVALSRAKSLEGLKVEGIVDGLSVGPGRNLEVQEFLKEKFGQAMEDPVRY